MTQLEYDNKTADIDKKFKNMSLIYLSAGVVGGVTGLAYAVMSGKSFWGKVGFFVLGSLVIGIPARIAVLSKTNSLVAEKEKLDNEFKAGSTTAQTTPKAGEKSKII